MSPNLSFDPGHYPPFMRRQAEALQDALAADTFRFDASDLMPPPIGDRVFWDAMMTYVDEGPESLDDCLLSWTPLARHRLSPAAHVLRFKRSSSLPNGSHEGRATVPAWTRDEGSDGRRWWRRWSWGFGLASRVRSGDRGWHPGPAGDDARAADRFREAGIGEPRSRSASTTSETPATAGPALLQGHRRSLRHPHERPVPADRAPRDGPRWLDAHVTAGLEGRFLRLRQLERWNDHDDEWEQRGSEHAAESSSGRWRARGPGRSCRRSRERPSAAGSRVRAAHRPAAPGLTARVPRACRWFPTSAASCSAISRSRRRGLRAPARRWSSAAI